MILLNFEVPIKGDSTVTGHEDWITLDSFQLGVNRAITHSGGGKDREVSNPSFSEVMCTKSADVSSTELAMQAICGKSLGKAEIHFIQTGGAEAKGQVFKKVTLGDAVISSYNESSSGERPMESFTISFNEVSFQYNPFDEAGTVTEGEEKGWNVMKNEVL